MTRSAGCFTVTGMVVRLAAVSVLFAVIVGGCGQTPPVTTAAEAAQMFAATEMRVHPIFTQVASWTHGTKPDGVEAHLEFSDQFHDTTKASGQVLFELFEYAPGVRGRRVGQWVGSLATADEQREKWMPTLRTYRFQLPYPAVSFDRSYLMTATFELTGGPRFPIDQIVLQGRKGNPKVKSRSGVGGGLTRAGKGGEGDDGRYAAG